MGKLYLLFCVEPYLFSKKIMVTFFSYGEGMGAGQGSIKSLKVRGP